MSNALWERNHAREDSPGKLFAQNKVRPFRCNKAPTTCKKACTHKKLKRSSVRLISLKLTCFYRYISVQLCVGITNYCKGFLQDINLMEPMRVKHRTFMYACIWFQEPENEDWISSCKNIPSIKSYVNRRQSLKEASEGRLGFKNNYIILSQLFYGKLNPLVKFKVQQVRTGE